MVSQNVSMIRIGLGCMSLSLEGRPERGKSVRFLKQSYDEGVRFFDTADCYGLGSVREVGHNEKLLAEAFLKGRSRRKGALVATKGGVIFDGQVWRPDGSAKHLKTACEASLKRLDCEQIFLYQLHRIDPRVALSESIETLADFQRRGWVKHLGVSNLTLEQLKMALRVVPIYSVQNQFNLFSDATEQRKILQFC